MGSSVWQVLARRRQEDINNAIPKAYHVPDNVLEGHAFIDLPKRSGILNDRELQITSMTATVLL